MTTQSTSTRTGGFAGDPFAALNPPAANITGCCSATETMTAGEGGTAPAPTAGDACCQPAAEQAGCC